MPNINTLTMIAVGVGIAPFIHALREIFRQKLDLKIVLLYGVVSYFLKILHLNVIYIYLE